MHATHVKTGLKNRLKKHDKNMTRYKVILEYDGTDLIGWQENRQGPSVQSLMKDAIEKFCGVRPDVVGAGRTDAGNTGASGG